MKNPLKAGAASFAHLIRKGKAEDDKENKSEDETPKEEDDENQVSNDEKDNEESASEEDTDPKKIDEKAETPEDDESDDDDSDDEGDESDDTKKERARCSEIFRSASAGKRPDMAGHLAFNTNMTVKQAVTALDVAAAGTDAAPTKQSNLARRMASQATSKVTPSGKTSATGTATKAEQIVKAYQNATK